MKLAIATVLFCFLSLSALGQKTAPKKTDTLKTYEQYLNVLSDVPKLFSSWLHNVEKIAEGQDRENFRKLAIILSRNITTLKNSKENFIKTIENNQKLSDVLWRERLSSIGNGVQALQNSLKKTDPLTEQSGLETAYQVSNKLTMDFNGKMLIIQNLSNYKNETEQEADINKLKAGIDLLNNASSKLDTLITKLQPKP